MPSIIPSPGSPPGSANVSATIELASDYNIAAGATLYADAVANLLRTAGLQIPYYSLVNAGTLWNRSTTSASVLDTYNFGSIQNSGLIVAEAGNGSAIAISVGSTFGGLMNSGRIFALSTGGAAIGVRDWAGLDLVNSGLIATSSSYQAWTIVRYNGGRVVNGATGSILAEGGDAIAVYLGRGHLTPPDAPELPDVDNAGRIEAVSTNPSAPSVGIFVGGLDHETMTIVNSGVIKGDYAIYASGSGFSPVQKSVQTVVNRSSGLIQGAISLDMGDDRILNEGRIEGYVDLFDGDDVFDNAAGTLVGAANLGWGDDRFVGGAQSDAVMGERDDDSIFGNGGNDIYQYVTDVDSTAAARDTISGFNAGDRIDLSLVDANGVGVAGNGTFAFIGAGAFTGAAGQLRATQASGLWTIEGDTNGDGVADLVIALTISGGHVIAATDFVL